MKNVSLGHENLAPLVSDGVVGLIHLTRNGNVEDVDDLLSRLVPDVALHVGKHGVKVGNGRSLIVDNGDVADADRALVSGSVGELELEVSGGPSVDGGHVHRENGVGTVNTPDVNLEGGVAHVLVRVVKESGEEVNTGRECPRPSERVLVLAEEGRPKLGLPVLKGGNLTLPDDGGGREDNLSVLLGLKLREPVERFKHLGWDGGHAEAIGEGLDLAKDGEDEFVPHSELLVGHGGLNDGVEAALVVLDETENHVVEEKGVKFRLSLEVGVYDGRHESRGVLDVLETLHGSNGDLLDVLRVTSEGVVDRLRSGGGKGDILNVESSRVGDNLLDLGGILERKGSQKVTGVDDGTRAHGVRDCSGLGGLDGHNHLHGLNLDVRLSSLNLLSGLLKVANDLTSNISAQLRRIEDGRHESGDAIDGEAETKRLLESEDTVGHATEVSDEGALGSHPDLDVNQLTIDGKADSVGGSAGDSELVLDVLVSDLDGELVHGSNSRE
mmetsp:Transcript_1672/g.3090  ORF Transcript_1672/g.3090 Transcript_1672/m.3090 type:complete len:498 (-) Transcript_1672:1912-3405(-)